MVQHLTFGVQSTCPVTGIATLLLDTGLILVAFIIDDALRPTSGRTAQVAGIAGAHGSRAQSFTGGVRSTRVGVARLYRLRRGSDHLRLALAVGEGVTFIVGRTGTNGVVGDDVAARVDTTAAGTRVLALLVEAGLVLGTV